MCTSVSPWAEAGKTTSAERIAATMAKIDSNLAAAAAAEVAAAGTAAAAAVATAGAGAAAAGGGTAPAVAPSTKA